MVGSLGEEVVLAMLGSLMALLGGVEARDTEPSVVETGLRRLVWSTDPSRIMGE
jgi:hypothetical protein